jgi:hypothetical protein
VGPAGLPVASQLLRQKILEARRWVGEGYGVLRFKIFSGLALRLRRTVIAGGQAVRRALLFDGRSLSDRLPGAAGCQSVASARRRRRDARLRRISRVGRYDQLLGSLRDAELQGFAAVEGGAVSVRLRSLTSGRTT